MPLGAIDLAGTMLADVCHRRMSDCYVYSKKQKAKARQLRGARWLGFVWDEIEREKRERCALFCLSCPLLCHFNSVLFSRCYVDNID